MWGCNYGPMPVNWWGGFFSGNLLSLLLWGSVLVSFFSK